MENDIDAVKMEFEILMDRVGSLHSSLENYMEMMEKVKDQITDIYDRLEEIEDGL